MKLVNILSMYFVMADILLIVHLKFMLVKVKLATHQKFESMVLVYVKVWRIKIVNSL
ncbi:unnamed protein product [Trichobilharzia regenti]|nr:unnamed protein product [Trichobilharzia regenti]